MTRLPLVALLLATSASASTDYACFNRCTAAGSSYGYCKSECSYEPFSGGSLDAPKSEPAGRVDYACLNACVAEGSLYGYCKQKCGY